MGALDTWSGSSFCPRCGEEHNFHHQTHFFKPEYGGTFEFCSRHFERWGKNPLNFAPEELQRARVWNRHWWRVREEAEPGVVTLLAELTVCTCGTALAVLLRFRLEAGDTGAAGAATLTELALLEALATVLPAAVDFVDIELSMPFPEDYDTYATEARALGAAPFPERAARLHAEMIRMFGPPDEEEEREGSNTLVTGEVRCESCDTEVERTLPLGRRFMESLLGPAWRGGVLWLGKHVDGDFGWLADDVDRGACLRLRHPLAPGRLTVMGRPQRWRCRCAVGRASPVLEFKLDAKGMTLDSFRYRFVNTGEAFNGKDFAESPGSFQPSPREGRDKVIEALVREWKNGG